jgi:cell wall-associated NlpC family hydrolase
LNKALLALCLLGAPLFADIRGEQVKRHEARVQAELAQLLWGQRVAKAAQAYIGQPYKWGGKAGDDAFDCSGYAQEVYWQLGVSLPASAFDQMQAGFAIERGAWQPGDLLFFRGQGSPWHVGIYQGGHKFLQAPGTGKQIQSTAFSKAWERRYISARRIPAPQAMTKTTTTKEHP